MASVLVELTAELASLLGIEYSLANGVIQWDDLPPVRDVQRWLLQAQRDLVAGLPADALSELWQITTTPDSDPDIPGAHILSVLVNGVEARQIALHERQLALSTAGLFRGTARSPKWWVESVESQGISQPRLRTSPESTPTVTYLPAPSTALQEIKLATHLWPACVRYAHYLALQADEDDAGAARAYQDFERTLGRLGLASTNRLGGPQPGEGEAS